MPPRWSDSTIKSCPSDARSHANQTGKTSCTCLAYRDLGLLKRIKPGGGRQEGGKEKGLKVGFEWHLTNGKEKRKLLGSKENKGLKNGRGK